VEAIIALGIDNSAIMNYFENKVPLIESTDSLESMLEKIKTWAKPGMQVLLSPACASFDLFRNYMHRGEAFKEIILKNYTK
jgi:UDP-N-acetylmuramoylalanine--D-glutamate ligase